MKFQKETKPPNNLLHGRWYGDACGAAFALELVGERWALLIIRELMLGPRRFSELRADLPGISAKILTERLAKLEQGNILRRRILPSPANAQVYELTTWGLSVEPILRELVVWAVQSPAHNPMLPLSPVSFMLSLRFMLTGDIDRDQQIKALFVFESGDFKAHYHDGKLTVARAKGEGTENTDIIFRAPSPNGCLSTFYGKQTLNSAGLGMTVGGDLAIAQRFIDLFRLPAKIG